jgi:hypothetical protein
VLVNIQHPHDVSSAPLVQLEMLVVINREMLPIFTPYYEFNCMDL